MFNSKSKSSYSNGEFSINSIGKGASVVGDIQAPDDIRIDGSLKGNLNCDARFILGAGGNVEGDIKCQSAIVLGRLTGTIEVRDSLEVGSSAILNGTVHTSKLIIDEGAVFNVECHMSDVKNESD
ncbi:MAG TPA: polymer-forming cytoskeletal protein [Saprospiraceae bacterium]|nr:polymer-forming cytoskeletal protein [Saprospiraceae bacterium]HQW55035.1 polymer-forming cytoskeletal protein [Saprospiraceae bacterium]